jgi:lactoylglutathione lyase
VITRIRSVGIQSDDQDGSVEFYEKLGFEKRRDEPMGPDARWIELAPSGCDTVLVPFVPGIVLECDDIQRTFEELRDQGVEFTMEPTEHDWGRFAQFKDPHGNEFGLIEA